MRINNPFVITPNSVFTAALEDGSVTNKKLASPETLVKWFRKTQKHRYFRRALHKRLPGVVYWWGRRRWIRRGVLRVRKSFASGGGGGSAGDFVFFVTPLTAGQNVPYTIGAGGAGGAKQAPAALGVAGQPGGATQFLLQQNAPGGNPGIGGTHQNTHTASTSYGRSATGLNAMGDTPYNKGGNDGVIGVHPYDPSGGAGVARAVEVARVLTRPAARGQQG